MLLGMKQNRCNMKWNKNDVAWNETKLMFQIIKQNRCCLECNKIDVAWNESKLTFCDVLIDHSIGHVHLPIWIVDHHSEWTLNKWKTVAIPTSSSQSNRMKQYRCCLEWIKIDVAWNESKSIMLKMNQNRCCLKWNKIDVAWNETKSMLLGMNQNQLD